MEQQSVSPLFPCMRSVNLSVPSLLFFPFTCVHTPSKTSTTTMAPSERRVAVETSEEKSMCPGESMRLMR